jgi:hypothetical protein
MLSLTSHVNAASTVHMNLLPPCSFICIACLNTLKLCTVPRECLWVFRMAGLCRGDVFPVRYELDFYILFGRNAAFKRLYNYSEISQSEFVIIRTTTLISHFRESDHKLLCAALS